MAVTIQDVAARANVSVATASRALRGTRRVSDSMARRVREAAEALQYRPNMVASALRRQVTDALGLVVPSIINPFFPALIEAVDQQLVEMSKQLLLCDSRNDAVIESHRLRSLIDRQVDGIIISPCDASESAAAIELAARRVPIVQIDRRVRGNATDWVGVDNAEGMRILCQHLAGVGASTVTFVGANPLNSAAKDRATGLAAACQDFGLRLDYNLFGDFTVAWGTEAGDQLLDQARLSDALVCGNDLIAIGILRAMSGAGVKVPEDVLVTGFDDISSASLATPQLTTVRQPHLTIAKEAVRLLNERLAHGDQKFQRVAVSPELVIRESTKKSC